MNVRIVKPSRRWLFVCAAVLAALVAFAARAGVAQAAPCDTWQGSNGGSWFTAGNWTGGVPSSSADACIDTDSVNISGSATAAQAKSLTLTNGATLNIEGDSSGNQGVLSLANGGSIDSTSSVVLTDLCNGSGCTPEGAVLLVAAGTLQNAGTITLSPGLTASSGRGLNGNITNTGSINVNAPANYDTSQSGGTLDNKGVLSIGTSNSAKLTVTALQGASTVVNDAGGSITNNNGSGSVLVDNSNTFTQGAGTTSPNTANPAHPAVVMDNGSALNYTGTGASTIEIVTGSTSLAGNLAAGQNLVIKGTGSGCQQALASASAGFTNAGTITLTGADCSGLKITSGTLANTGTIVADTTATNITREIAGSLTNSGTLDINGATAFDGGTATLTQTAGTTSIAAGQIFDTSGSGATFQLQGGTLTGGGQSQATAAVVNGPVNNAGGTVIPGSTSTPGLMTVGDYTQGAGGTLKVVVDGPGGPTGVGTAYTQLSSTGNMTLGGTLAITTVAQPAVGDFDTIAGGNGTRSGTFSTVTGAFTPGQTFGYKAAYGSNFAALDVGGLLQVKRSGPGTGSVTSSPSGINCGAQCSALFFDNQLVTLRAHPGSGSAFGGWSGACTGANLACQVTMSQAKTVTARFIHATTTSLSSSRNPAIVGKKVRYTATVTPRPNGGTVRFTSNGSSISGCAAVPVNTTTGTATCSVTYRSKGTRKIKASYSGHATFGKSASSVLTETVTK